MAARGHLHVEVSDESRAGWQAFADEHQVTIAALVEAVGLVLASDLPGGLRNEIVSIAAQVTAERRSRRPAR